MRPLTMLPFLFVLSISASTVADDAVTKWNPPISPIGSKNLIPNASFECGTSGWIPCGKSTGWGGNVSDLLGVIQVGDAKEGKNSFRIDLGPGKTIETFFDCWPPARTIQSAPQVANWGWIRVEKCKIYTLSAFMKADKEGISARLAMRFAGTSGPYRLTTEQTKAVTLSTQWSRYALTVPAENSDMFVVVGPDLSVMPEATATVWIDGIQLEQAEVPTDFQPREAVEIGITTGRPGNLYDSREPCAITVLVSNTLENSARVPITVRVEDYFGELLPEKSLKIHAKPHSTTLRSIPLNLPGPGHYRVTFAWESQGIKQFKTLSLAVVEPYTANNSPFGINHAPVTPDMCKTFRKGGIVWVRDWSPNWQFIEPVQGQVNFDDTDKQIDRVLQTGMKVMSVLPSNPSTNWASEAPASVPATGWKRLAYAPTKPELLNEFVGKVVSRYKDRVKHWEFLNEPVWCSDFCMPKEGGYTSASYLSLLKGVYGAMKTADPACQVLGGLSTEAMFPIGDEIVAAGGLNYMDILNLHPYPDPGTSAPEQLIPHMERILGVMDANGGRKPIWATETGYYAMDVKPWEPWTPPKEVHAAGILLRDERQCGDYTVRYSVILLSHGVDKIFFHQGIGGEPNCSLLNMDNPFLGPQGVPTKAYSALAGLANALGSTPHYVSPLAKASLIDGRDTKGVFGYAFQCAPKATLVAWAPDWGDVRWTITLPHGATARNVVGKRIKGHEIQLGESPIYIETVRMEAHVLAESCKLVITSVNTR